VAFQNAQDPIHVPDKATCAGLHLLVELRLEVYRHLLQLVYKPLPYPRYMELNGHWPYLTLSSSLADTNRQLYVQVYAMLLEIRSQG
jgi:hypothetical protein